MLKLGFLGSTIVNCRYTIPSSLAAPEHYDRVVAWVEDAIARVVLEHPALRLNVVNADTKRPAWVDVDSVDFAHHVQWQHLDENNGDTAANHDKMLHERIEKILDEPYTNLVGRPHWRILILFKTKDKPFIDIVFDYSHSFSDGTGGKIFHETLLRMLNTPPTTNETEAKIEAEAKTEAALDQQKQHPTLLTNRVLTVPANARRLPPPCEKTGKFPVSTRFALLTAWRELRPSGLSPQTASQARWAPIQATPYRTRLRVFDIAPAVVRAIIAACRTHKTTLTGLLHALVLAALASRVPASEAMAFTGGTALDLRRHLLGTPKKTKEDKKKKKRNEEPDFDFDPKRTMANYVSLTPHEFGVDLVREIRDLSSPQDGAARGTVAHKDGDKNENETPSPALVDLVWNCAARVRGEIQKRLDKGLKNDIVGLMRLVPDWRAQFRTEASKPRVTSFVVTNLGVVDGVGVGARNEGTNLAAEEEDLADREEAWGIEHAVFAVSAEVCGAAFQVAPISVKDGALCVSCSWQDCVVDLEMAEAIVADLERWLRFLGSS